MPVLNNLVCVLVSFPSCNMCQTWLSVTESGVLSLAPLNREWAWSIDAQQLAAAGREAGCPFFFLVLGFWGNWKYRSFF